MNIQEYVVGFLFRPDYQRVILIQKTKPEWQKGKYNGVGGKIEPGETGHYAMTREFFEETGADVPIWQEFGIMRGTGWSVRCFAAVSDVEVKTTTDETVVDRHVSVASDREASLPNLGWLVPMAVEHLKNKDGVVWAEVHYK